jgi:hypothetical protein
MSTSTNVAQITYPQSDGQPIADNTKQFRWIGTIQGGLDALLCEDPQVFVVGKEITIKVQFSNQICTMVLEPAKRVQTPGPKPALWRLIQERRRLW